METEALIRIAAQGDKEALIQLILTEKEAYYKLAYVYMKNPEDAMDALEDMIVLVYENINSLKKEEAFYSWSKTILVNCCKKLLRKNKKLIPVAHIRDAVDDGAFKAKDDQLDLELSLLQLTEKHREILKLRYFLDLDCQTIACLLKIPIGTVKSRISKGLQKLRDKLGGEE